MELYLDTASIAEVERSACILPITGITTDPSIVAANGESIWDVLPCLRNVIDEEDILFVQTTSHEAQGMVEEARCLGNAVPGLAVKIPVTSKGLAVTRMLKKKGIAMLETAVYGVSQGLLTALAGAKYIAPCTNCIDAQSGDGVRTIQELQTLLELHAPNSMVLAASFKTPHQALDCLLAGREAITLSLDVV